MLANNPALAELFTLQPGQMTNLFEGDDVRAMYRLDEIVPPYTQTFAEVKARVHDLYLVAQKGNAPAGKKFNLDVLEFVRTAPAP